MDFNQPSARACKTSCFYITANMPLNLVAFNRFLNILLAASFYNLVNKE